MKSTIEREKKKQWSTQQNALLKELYSNFSSKKWKKIAQIFKQKGYDRSQLQIRERWTNFEDPSLLFTEWTDQELETLYKSYTKFGSKWCFIKRTIPGRTQNKIKNKFYGNIRIYLRFVVNYFNSSKQDTMWIHKINPSILNDIYRGTQQFSSFGNEMEVAIQQMGYNVDKIRLLSRIQNKQIEYKAFYDKVILLYKNIQQKSEKPTKAKKTQNTSHSELNPSLTPQDEIEEEKNSESQQKEEKQQIREISQLNRNEMVSVSNNYEYQLQSLAMNRAPFDMSNYPLLQFQNSYPYFNSWFYPY